MNYSVRILAAAQKQLSKLSQSDFQRVDAAISALVENPRPPGCKKMRDSDYWRIRVGDYRVVYEIADTVKVVLVVRVAHRSEAYR